MNDIVLWLVASGSTLVSFGIGRRLGRRRPGPSSAPREVEAICGCEHALAVHDPETNRCHDDSVTERVWSDSFASYITRNKQCSCRQYTGPRPIDQVFQPGYILPEGEK